MTAVGKVFLVGAGPGDPGLLTLKGKACLEQADVVLYDGLVNPLLLRHTRAQAEKIGRVAEGGKRVLHQEEINRQLIELAQAGKTVVRLKGGDPFIFGRGSEEAAALREQGIPFEVVPGITAATAAGTYAGFSLTHRQQASAVAFITGHEDPEKPSSALDYRNLAEFRGTLVFYMGLHRLPAIVEALLAAGKDPATPGCVICRATWPQQRSVTAPLRELAEQVAAAGLTPPSLIIIGECVRQRERIDWFDLLPLRGQRIGVTRPVDQAEAAVQRILELGGQPILLPAIQILPPETWDEVDEAICRLAEFDWLVFTSANGVRNLLDRLWETGGDVRLLSRLKLAAIGPATAQTLAEYHLRADVVPETYRAEALAADLVPLVRGQRVLWAGANRGREVLREELSAAGALVEKVTVYRNLDCPELTSPVAAQLERDGLDWIGLSSPSIARSLPALLPAAIRGQLGQTIRLAAISPVTASAAAEIGLPVAAVATEFTWDGLIDAIRRAVSLKS